MLAINFATHFPAKDSVLTSPGKTPATCAGPLTSCV